MRSAQAPVDFDQPLLRQVGALGAQYDAWVHRSIKPRDSLRVFENETLERLSHIRWWTVLVVWVPIVVALLALPVLSWGLSPGRVLVLALGGLALWTLVEYVFHRFAFHYKPTSSLGQRIHFLSHGIHHVDPWDPTRLVFPPLAGLGVATPIFLVLWLAVSGTETPLPTACATMGGLLAGYIVYDMTHYYTHHGKPRSRYGKWLRAWHLAHHHKHWERMFGVSSPLWDFVFRTGRPPRAHPAAAIPAASAARDAATDASLEN